MSPVRCEKAAEARRIAVVLGHLGRVASRNAPCVAIPRAHRCWLGESPPRRSDRLSPRGESRPPRTMWSPTTSAHRRPAPSTRGAWQATWRRALMQVAGIVTPDMPRQFSDRDVNPPRGRLHRVRTRRASSMTLTRRATVRARPMVRRCRRRGPVHEDQSTRRAHTVGRPQSSRCRRVPAAAVSDDYAVVRVIVNDVLPK